MELRERGGGGGKRRLAEREYFMASACTGAGSWCKSNRELRAATRPLVSRGTTSYIFVCSRNILTPDCVLTRTQGKSIGREREEKKEKKRNGRGRDRKMDEVSREKFERTPFGHYLGYNDALSRAEVGKSRLVDNAIVLMGRERQVKLPF